MNGDRRAEFAEDYDPPSGESLNGYRPEWRRLQRRLHLAFRPWPTVPSSERCDVTGRLILQHRFTGRVRALPVTCRTWACPGCGGRKARDVLEILRVAWKPDTELWWAWGSGGTDRDRLQKQLRRRKSTGHVWIRRRDSFHLFADGPLSRGREMTQSEGLVVARFALRPGVVRVSGPWMKTKVDPMYVKIDFASATAARVAQERAEASILGSYGIAYSFEESDPPPGMADDFAAEFIAALALSRFIYCSDDEGDVT